MKTKNIADDNMDYTDVTLGDESHSFDGDPVGDDEDDLLENCDDEADL